MALQGISPQLRRNSWGLVSGWLGAREEIKINERVKRWFGAPEEMEVERREEVEEEGGELVQAVEHLN